MTNEDKKTAFWESLIRGVEAGPREAYTLRGASGLLHPVVALGADEPRRRVVIISGESDARSAALAHADIQAAMPAAKVVMARPAPINLGQAAKVLSDMIGKAWVSPADLGMLGSNPDEAQAALQNGAQRFFEKASPAITSFQFASLNFLAVWKEVIQQLSLAEVEPPVLETPESADTSSKNPTLRFNRLMTLDPVEVDRQMGVCSVPLYELKAEEIEVFHAGKDVEHVRDILKRHDVFQYFFPAADHLALGLVENANAPVNEILDRLTTVPEMGHPFGTSEIVPADVKLQETICALREQGLLVEGELGLELTPSGVTTRATVRFKPREGLLSKIANIISVKVDLTLKDFFK